MFGLTNKIRPGKKHLTSRELEMFAYKGFTQKGLFFLGNYISNGKSESDRLTILVTEIPFIGSQIKEIMFIYNLSGKLIEKVCPKENRIKNYH